MDELNFGVHWQHLREDYALCDATLEFPTKVLDDITTADGPVRLGINNDGMQVLLLPCDTPLLSRTLPESVGLKLEVKHYTVKNRKILFLEVLCLQTELNQTFSDLSVNICERVRKGQGPLQAVTDAIDDFRELLKRLSLRVTDEQVLGLLGELLQLRLFSDNNIDVVEWWTGPDKKRHDFTFAGVSIEVKTSQRTDMPMAVIHGLDQLLPPPNGKLFLSYFRVEAVPKGGLTIPSLIDDLITKIAASSLRDKLELCGYSEDTREIWEKFSWNLMEQRFFKVDNNFPKLTVEELGGKPIPGISTIQYHINLDQAEASRIDEKRLLMQVQGTFQ